MKELNERLNAIIYALLGVFVGQSASRVINYKLHPEKYSGDLFSSIRDSVIISAVILFGAIGIVLIIKWIVNKRNK